MDCLYFADRLEALLDGALPEHEQARAAAHAAGCADCRALRAAMQAGLEPPAAETPEGLTEAILARTSGPPCGRAQALLSDLVDGLLDDADRDLVGAHLLRCAGCAALAAALARLPDDLPAFAELQPDARLVDDVLARTRPRQPRRAALRDRVREAGRRLGARPRIAWETGYVAALVLWLICGASWSPYRTTAVEAQALIQRGAAGTHDAGARSLAVINQAVTTVSRQTLHVAARSTKVAARSTREAASRLAGLSSRYRRAAGAAPDLGRHWRQLSQALQVRDLFSGVDALRSLSLDAGAMLAELLFAPSATASSTDTEPTPSRRIRR